MKLLTKAGMTVLAAAALSTVGASAASAQSCYPVGAVGCEQPAVKPTSVTNPGPDTDPGTNPAPGGDVLAATGADSSIWLIAGFGLVAAGGASVVAARKSELSEV